MAAEHHIDLSQVQGSGLNGRITRQDVLSYLEHPTVKTGVIHSGTGATITNPNDTLLPMTTIRRQIGERMQLSHRTSPHVLTVMEADLSCVTAHRSANKQAFAADGVNLTYTAYLITAIAAGLKAQPLVNSSWTEQGILIHSEINIGMATSLGADGLIVPVLKHADELSLLGIARAVNDLANRARTKKLRPEEVRDGTFTLTNHGTGGSLFAMPIINQPQCGILGVGLIQKRPVVVTDADGNDSIAIRPMVYLSFVFDHRILDGASADAFLVHIKQTLDNWPS
jgi:2-oxoglutarate dehydrogenase E2 component (dihydrolipoamide succinyltransferase)